MPSESTIDVSSSLEKENLPRKRLKPRGSLSEVRIVPLRVPHREHRKLIPKLWKFQTPPRTGLNII
jgi:hypothetical protein